MSSDDELNAKLKRLAAYYHAEADQRQHDASPGVPARRAGSLAITGAAADALVAASSSAKPVPRRLQRRAIPHDEMTRRVTLMVSGCSAGLLGGFAIGRSMAVAVAAALVLAMAISVPRISAAASRHRVTALKAKADVALGRLPAGGETAMIGQPAREAGQHVREQAPRIGGPDGPAEQRTPVNFWEALDPGERKALASMGSVLSFAPGTTLMREGERADHVIVILSGRTTICVGEKGRERVLAVRGPGDLVGERAAFHVRVRSASVIALETIQALVVRAQDFAAFIDAHLRVLQIVESLIYDRLSEKPASDEGRDDLRADENCTIILSDVVGFGARTRNDDDRRVIREALFSMTHTALQEVSNIGSWDDRGDGLMVVIPPSVSAARIMRELFKELPAELDRHNSKHGRAARIKLRVAVNVGPVAGDIMGVSGEAVMLAARLARAPAFREAVAASEANVGVIASAFVYENVIRRSMDTADLAGYSRIQVDVTERIVPAWMKLLSQNACA